MNAAARKIRRVQLHQHLEALIDWRSDLTVDIFDMVCAKQELLRRRKAIDLAIDTAFLELQLLAEGK